MVKGKAKVLLFRALRSGSSSSWKSLVGIMLLLGATLVALAISVASSIPLHASCKIDWNFGINCTEVNVRIVNQIKAWRDKSNCKNRGEKCLYTLKTNTGKEVTATHTTPVHRYLDDLKFDFTVLAKGQCAVKGYSRSELWYAFLDYGTNYCNLHNLITGSKLDLSPGYEEKTTNKICTQYSTANCEKY